MSVPWTLAQRAAALARAERDGVDVLVIGGGITGAGVLRDAASRGLRVLLVERLDFGAGTSGSSSKMVHGGLRYLAQGHPGLTREACRERDLLLRLNPNLIRGIPFLVPCWEGGKLKPWQVKAALFLYYALSGFRPGSRFRMLGAEQVARYSRDLRQDGLRGAGLYRDAQVDDARLVLETVKSARSLGGEAVNHAEVVEFSHDAAGRIRTLRVRDRLAERSVEIRAHAVVNAAGPAVERVRGLDRDAASATLRPAKGIHLVIPRRRVHIRGVITFEAHDRRPLFLLPWDDMCLVGTTDDFSDEIDEPVVTIDEVHYLLAAANEAFPGVALNTNDIVSVFAGVRPLVADEDSARPPSSVSREYRVTESRSGLLSVAGGKLTTYRAVGERVVDRLLRRLPVERRRAAGPSRTAALPLREDRFDAAQLREELQRRFELTAERAMRLVRVWGADAPELLAAAPRELRRPIGASRFLWAEIPWAFRHEAPATLCDLLERRLRLALFASGQGLPELPRIAAVAAEAAGWDDARSREEAQRYAQAVRRRYQIVSPGALRQAQSAA